MKLSILKIILWPKDRAKSLRIIEFREKGINVITGDSKTGKSSLTWIVDYCLGSGKCSIPVGIIRDKVDWYGLHLKLENTEMIVARRNPGENQSTNEVFWNEGLDLEVPPDVKKNGRMEDVITRFNQISHLPSLDFKKDDQDYGFGHRPSFRDMAAFTFQPQHIVANPFTLYFKADTTEHREKLKIIFPFVLGAVSAEDLAKQKELDDLESHSKRLSRDIETLKRSNQVWEAEIQSYFSQAKEYGLIPVNIKSDPNWTAKDFIAELEKIKSYVESSELPKVSDEAISSAAKEISTLIKEEDLISRNIGIIRRRLSKIDLLSQSVSEYSNSLLNHKDRLAGLGWLENKFNKDEHQTCPLCKSEHFETVEELKRLTEIANQYKNLSQTIENTPTKLDKEELELKTELKVQVEQLTFIRDKRKELEDKNEELASKRQQTRQVYLFIGRIQQALKNYQADSKLYDLRQKLAEINSRIADLRKQLEPKERKYRLNRAIQIISRRISEYAKQLELEHWNESIILNDRELTLNFTSASGRKDFLWEIGSGANWMGYHIASFLSLHEYFLTVANNPVPSFIIFDQPSQVYYPEKWPENEDEQEMIVPEDIAGVKRIFKVLSEAVEATSEELQIIITEHAGPLTWNNIEDIHPVGNWRMGKDEPLIPNEWQ